MSFSIELNEIPRRGSLPLSPSFRPSSPSLRPSSPSPHPPSTSAPPSGGPQLSPSPLSSPASSPIPHPSSFRQRSTSTPPPHQDPQRELGGGPSDSARRSSAPERAPLRKLILGGGEGTSSSAHHQKLLQAARRNSFLQKVNMVDLERPSWAASEPEGGDSDAAPPSSPRVREVQRFPEAARRKGKEGRERLRKGGGESEEEEEAEKEKDEESESEEERKGGKEKEVEDEDEDEKGKGKGKGKEKGKGKGKEKGKEKVEEEEKEEEEGKEEGKKGKDIGKDEDQEDEGKERVGVKEKQKDQEEAKGRDKDKDSGKEKETGQEKEKDKESGRGKGKGKGKDKDKDKGKEKEKGKRQDKEEGKSSSGKKGSAASAARSSSSHSPRPKRPSSFSSPLPSSTRGGDGQGSSQAHSSGGPAAGHASSLSSATGSSHSAPSPREQVRRLEEEHSSLPFKLGLRHKRIRLLPAIFLLNAALVIICVISVAAFSFTSGKGEVTLVLARTGAFVIETLSNRLLINLAAASTLPKSVLSSLALSPAVPITSPEISRLLYDAMARRSFSIGNVYVGDTEGRLNGASSVPMGQNLQIVIGLVTSETFPVRYRYLPNPACTSLNSTCELFNPEKDRLPDTRDIINVTSRPWFQQSLTSGGGIVGPFLALLSRQLVISVSYPLSRENLTIVAGSDLRLLSLSSILRFLGSSLQNTESSYSLLPNGTLASPPPTLTSYFGAIDFSAIYTSFVVEAGGNLIATSTAHIWEVQNISAACNNQESCLRIHASRTSNEVIRRLSCALAGPGADQWAALIPENTTLHSTQLSLGGSTYVILVKRLSVLGVTSWYLVVALNADDFLRKYQRLGWLVIPGATVLLISLSLLISFFITRSVAQKLRQMTQMLLQISSLDFSGWKGGRGLSPQELRLRRRLHRSHIREIVVMNLALEAMRSGLDSFSHYVPHDVVRLLQLLRREAVLGVDEATLTIMFSDIADFTTVSEQLQPRQLVELLSRYLDEMSSIIIESYGVVDKYIGDAIMAFWNSPLKVANHPSVACRVALHSQERLRELHWEWLEKGLPLLKMRIGIHTGNVLVGNLGAPDRLNYTCIGDNVNLASRLEGLNKAYKTQIIISETVYQFARLRYVCRPMDYVIVKGKNRSVLVYELVGAIERLRDEAILAIKIYNQAFESMLARKFLKAKMKFEEFLGLVGEDCPAQKHLKTCDEFALNPPPPDWDPVVKADK